jgi:hypothetical protein
MKRNFSIILLSAAIIISSCKDKKSESPTPSNLGPLSIHMVNRAGSETLVLGNNYVNANGDTLKFSIFNYYISNIKLIKEDGSEWSQPYDSSYYLIKQIDPSSTSFIIPDVPAGNYTGISFIIGVDSAKSVSSIDDRPGVLDPTQGAKGMYWAWNSGYIFFKAEGTSPQAPINPNTSQRTFMYHIGGYGGYTQATVNNIKQVTLQFPAGSKAEVGNDASPELYIVADVLEMFISPEGISVGETPVVMDGKSTKVIAENYKDMFSIDHIDN